MIAKTADPDPAHPGDTVRYTLTVTNRSGFPVDPATVTDDLSDVVNGAVYNDDETALTGTVTTSGTDLHWSGTLADGATATIRYSATVDSGPAGQS